MSRYIINKIKKYISQNNLTESEFAEMCCVSQGTVSRWVNQKVRRINRQVSERVNCVIEKDTNEILRLNNQLSESELLLRISSWFDRKKSEISELFANVVSPHSDCGASISDNEKKHIIKKLKDLKEFIEDKIEYFEYQIKG